MHKPIGYEPADLFLENEYSRFQNHKGTVTAKNKNEEVVLWAA